VKVCRAPDRDKSIFGFSAAMWDNCSFNSGLDVLRLVQPGDYV
jgi:hypothetical protein